MAKDTEETEEEQQRHETGGTETSFDDKRFEVKWRKKGSESSPASPAAPRAEIQESPEETADLDPELKQAREQVDNLRDRWQRAAADLANLKRRTEEEKGEVEKFANMILVAELLPVLDNFERALETIPGNLAMLTWLHGVILIERHFRAILERQGLTEIKTENEQFNPALHEAIAEKETDELPAGAITQVYQKGYELHGRIIRPALVEIAKTPSKQQTEAASSERTETAEEAETQNVGP